MRAFLSVAAAALTIGAGPASAQGTTWLLLSFDRSNNMAVLVLSSQAIPMASPEQCQAEGKRISEKFRNVRTEFACVPGIAR